jgi:uncharacterized surface protein with fasciclin (FAS1) repeats
MMKYFKPVVAIVMAVAMLTACHNHKSHKQNINEHKNTTLNHPFATDSTFKSKSNNSITAVVTSKSKLSTLVNLINDAGEAQMLNNKGPFTLFAPNNKAFDKMSKKGHKRFTTLKNPKLTNWLNYLIVKGTFNTDSLKSGQTLTTLNGKKLKIEKSGDSLMVNHAKIIKSNVQASNGMVQIIDRVLVPPH